jgi:hypothetical protein
MSPEHCRAGTVPSQDHPRAAVVAEPDQLDVLAIVEAGSKRLVYQTPTIVPVAGSTSSSGSSCHPGRRSAVGCSRSVPGRPTRSAAVTSARSISPAGARAHKTASALHLHRVPGRHDLRWHAWGGWQLVDPTQPAKQLAPWPSRGRLGAGSASAIPGEERQGAAGPALTGGWCPGGGRRSRPPRARSGCR